MSVQEAVQDVGNAWGWYRRRETSVGACRASRTTRREFVRELAKLLFVDPTRYDMRHKVRKFKKESCNQFSPFSIPKTRP